MRATRLLRAVLSLVALGTTGLVTTPAEAQPDPGRRGDSLHYKTYVSDVYGADLGACRTSARKGSAWRIHALIGATAATRDDIIGGLSVLRHGQSTGREFNGGAAARQSSTGSVVVPRKSGYTVMGYVGIDGAGDSFACARRRPALLKTEDLHGVEPGCI